MAFPPPPGLLTPQISQQVETQLPQNSDNIRTQGIRVPSSGPSGVSMNVSQPPSPGDELSDSLRAQKILQDILKVLQDSTIAKKDEDDKQDILKVLQDPTIAKKDEDDKWSSFWSTYDRVAQTYDDKFISRNNSDMDIVLVFSGLFSAVNTAFIIAMQPNSTTVLLSQYLQNSSPSTTISTLTDPGANSVLATWSQSCAYFSLLLNLTAAFGAVLGKQWLGYYKSDDTTEGSGRQRQEKLDALQTWHFRAVLQCCPTLLQISLFLFMIAISTFAWSQQGIAAIAVIVPAGFSILIFNIMILTSLIYPKCPFQTPSSAMIRAVWRFLKKPTVGRANVQFLHDGSDGWLEGTHSVVPLVNWLFEVSTDPEVITSAARLLPIIKLTPEKLNIPIIGSRLRSTLGKCLRTGILSSSAHQRALECRMALLRINEVVSTGKEISQDPYSLSSEMPTESDAFEQWSHWHDTVLQWSLQDCKSSFIQYTTTKDHHDEKRAHDALRFAIMTGCPGFLESTDVALIWDGVFDWSNDPRKPGDFDWLVDFLVHFRTSGARDLAMADALLALSAMQGLGTPSRRESYFNSIIFSMQADKPSRLRHAALRAAFSARKELVSIAEQKGEFRKELLMSLAPALLTATVTKPDGALQLLSQGQDDPDAPYNRGREYFYLRLIFKLAKQRDWSTELKKAGHIDRCAGLLKYVIHSDDIDSVTGTSSKSIINNHPYYLAGALIRMNTAENYRDSCFTDLISDSEWWKLLKGAWSAMWWNGLYDEDDALEALSDVVKYTLEALKTEPAKYDWKSLVRLVNRTYMCLEDRGGANNDILSAVKDIKVTLNWQSAVPRIRELRSGQRQTTKEMEVK